MILCLPKTKNIWSFENTYHGNPEFVMNEVIKMARHSLLEVTQDDAASGQYLRTEFTTGTDCCRVVLLIRPTVFEDGESFLATLLTVNVFFPDAAAGSLQSFFFKMGTTERCGLASASESEWRTSEQDKSIHGTAGSVGAELDSMLLVSVLRLLVELPLVAPAE